MSFRDLPCDWPRRPLTDLDLVHDVLDLCVSEAVRGSGGLCVLALREDLRLAQPVLIEGLPMGSRRRGMLSNLVQACTAAGPVGAIIVAIVHRASIVSDNDRALHQEVIEVCRAGDVRLLSAHLVSCSGVKRLPALSEAA